MLQERFKTTTTTTTTTLYYIQLRTWNDRALCWCWKAQMTPCRHPVCIHALVLDAGGFFPDSHITGHCHSQWPSARIESHRLSESRMLHPLPNPTWFSPSWWTSVWTPQGGQTWMVQAFSVWSGACMWAEVVQIHFLSLLYQNIHCQHCGYYIKL